MRATIYLCAAGSSEPPSTLASSGSNRSAQAPNSQRTTGPVRCTRHTSASGCAAIRRKGKSVKLSNLFQRFQSTEPYGLSLSLLPGSVHGTPDLPSPSLASRRARQIRKQTPRLSDRQRSRMSTEDHGGVSSVLLRLFLYLLSTDKAGRRACPGARLGSAKHPRDHNRTKLVCTVYQARRAYLPTIQDTHANARQREDFLLRSIQRARRPRPAQHSSLRPPPLPPLFTMESRRILPAIEEFVFTDAPVRHSPCNSRCHPEPSLPETLHPRPPPPSPATRHRPSGRQRRSRWIHKRMW